MHKKTYKDTQNVRGTAFRALSTSTFAFFIGFAAVTLFSPLVHTLSLTPTQVGLLLSISSLTGSLLRIPFAAMVDSIGGKIPTIILLSIASVGMGGITFMLSSGIDTFSLLLLFGAFAGTGIATFAVGIAQISYWHPQNIQGHALGLFAGIGGLAPGIVVYLITNYLMQQVALQTIYLLWTITLVVGTIIYAIFAKNASFFQLKKQGHSISEAQERARKEYKQELFPRGNAMQSLLSSIKKRYTWVLIFAYFFSFGGYLALSNWFSEFFHSFHHMSIAVAGALSALYSVGASLSRAFGGKFSDIIGGRKACLLAFAVSALGSLLLASNGNFVFHLIGLVCMMLGMGFANAAIFKMLPTLLPDAIGAAAGLVGGLGAFGGFVLPNILSQFLNATSANNGLGYLHGFYLFTVLIAVSAVFVYRLPKDRS